MAIDSTTIAPSHRSTSGGGARRGGAQGGGHGHQGGGGKKAEGRRCETTKTWKKRGENHGKMVEIEGKA